MSRSEPPSCPFTPHAEVVERAHQALAAPCGQVPTPCIKVCQMDQASGYCCGCWRSLQEIGAWQNLGDAARRQIWHAIVARSKAAGA